MEKDDVIVSQGPPPSQDPEKLAGYIRKLNKARDERTLPRKEFDGMSFEVDYARNRECTFSYLRPKKNDDDVRVNSGTAEKKIELMLNELIGMNFQPEVRAYDDNDLELVAMSSDFTDLVRCTNEQEVDEDMWEEVYIDLLTQRVALVEETLTDTLPGGYASGNRDSQKRGVKRRISPLQFYPGDIYVPARRLAEQPYIVVYDRMLYDEAKVLYGHLEEFKHVRPGANMHDDYLPWFKYRFSSLKADEVEVIHYMSSKLHEDDDQLILNSVMMFPKGRGMQVEAGYPVKAATVKGIPDFFYGKPPIASAKFLQALQDETLRNLVRKMRQAIEPPIGLRAGKVPTRDMWSPAAVTQGLSADNFTRLVEHDGVTTSEFQMMQLIVQKTEEFIGAVNIQNQPGAGDMTATQIIELQKQAIKMIGTVVLAIIRLKRDATFARLETVLKEYTKPTKATAVGGKAVKSYRSFEIPESRTAAGETVTKYINFTDRFLSEAELAATLKAEEAQSKDGRDVRHSFVNVEALKQVAVLFKVVVTPESRDSSSLDRVLFQDRMNQAATISQLSGKPLNADKMVADFERVWKTRGWFQDATTAAPGSPEQMLQGLQQMASGGETALPQPSPQGQKMKPRQQPSLETLNNATK